MIWDSDKIDHVTKKIINDGAVIKGEGNPFYEVNKYGVALRKPNLIYNYNSDEYLELAKSKISVIYFAQNYCKVKNENSEIKLIPLRDYQFDILNMYDANRFNILFASRQVGKCVVDANIITSTDNTLSIRDLYLDQNPTILNRIKKYIYKLIDYLES